MENARKVPPTGQLAGVLPCKGRYPYWKATEAFFSAVFSVVFLWVWYILLARRLFQFGQGAAREVT